MRTLYIDKNVYSKKVNENLKDIIKKYGSKFIIKYKEYNIPVRLFLYKNKYNNHQKYYVLEYYEEKPRDPLLPFQIIFYDLFGKNTEHAYISNIHKTDKISGSTVVHFVINVLKLLNVQFVSLHDGATIDCGAKRVRLSLYKLIEKKRTFYQKFGFKYFVTKGTYGHSLFDNEENVHRLINKCVKEIRKIKIINMIKICTNMLNIMTQVIKEQKYDELDIIRTNLNEVIYYDKIDTNRKTVIEFMHHLDNILRIMKTTKKKYLYQLLKDLFNSTQCDDYLIIEQFLQRDVPYQVKYKHKKITIDYAKYFNILANVVHLEYGLKLK